MAGQKANVLRSCGRGQVAFSQSHAQAVRVFYSRIAGLENPLAFELLFFSKDFTIPTPIPTQIFSCSATNDREGRTSLLIHRP
jgi:hypothetical protein